MGNSNLTSSFNKGISFLCLWTYFFVVDLELEVEDRGEGGIWGGSYPSSLFPFEDSPRFGHFRSK
jgi:hypothetical protein